MQAKRVLIADDDPFILGFCRIVLESAGHAVSTAESGEQAVLLHAKEHPDVALIDLVMPGMGGLETLRQIRQADPDTAVVLITAHAEKEPILQALRLGAKELLEKPLDVDTLVSVVARVSRSAPGRTLRGDLRSMSLPTLLQACCGDKREGRLRIRQAGDEALLHLADGAVVHAELPGARGEEAFYRLLRWTDGAFELDSDVPPPERTIFGTLQELLLEGFRRLDEKETGGGVGVLPVGGPLDRAPAVDESLRTLAARTDGFLAAALIERTGTVLASRTAPEAGDLSEFGVSAAVLAGAARSAMARFGNGSLEECTLHAGRKVLVIRPVGDETLVMLADSLHAGQVRLAVKDASARLAASLAANPGPLRGKGAATPSAG